MLSFKLTYSSFSIGTPKRRLCLGPQSVLMRPNFTTNFKSHSILFTLKKMSLRKGFRNIFISVHGEWGEWSEWSLCSSSCGGGTRERSRKCDSPAPAFGGHYCSGSHVQIDYCNNAQCPGNFLYFFFLSLNHTWHPSCFIPIWFLNIFTFNILFYWRNFQTHTCITKFCLCNIKFVGGRGGGIPQKNLFNIAKAHILIRVQPWNYLWYTCIQ